MNLPEAREKFIQSWGSLGSQWGINKTMAQIHALLLFQTLPHFQIKKISFNIF